MTPTLTPSIEAVLEAALEAIHATVKASARPWLSCKEAMEYLGVSRSTLDLYRAQGLISFAKLPNGDVRFRRSTLEAFLEGLVV